MEKTYYYIAMRADGEPLSLEIPADDLRQHGVASGVPIAGKNRPVFFPVSKEVHDHWVVTSGLIIQTSVMPNPLAVVDA